MCGAGSKIRVPRSDLLPPVGPTLILECDASVGLEIRGVTRCRFHSPNFASRPRLQISHPNLNSQLHLPTPPSAHASRLHLPISPPDFAFRFSAANSALRFHISFPFLHFALISPTTPWSPKPWSRHPWSPHLLASVLVS